jgi:hypothetical protein
MRSGGGALGTPVKTSCRENEGFVSLWVLACEWVLKKNVDNLYIFRLIKLDLPLPAPPPLPLYRPRSGKFAGKMFSLVGKYNTYAPLLNLLATALSVNINCFSDTEFGYFKYLL